MKMKYIISFFLLWITNSVLGQEAKPNAAELTKLEVESHVRFLASDELEGRKSGFRGNNIAARYIAEQFRRAGVKKIPNSDSYFQTFTLDQVTPAEKGTMTFEGNTLSHGKEILVMSGNALEYNGEVVFAKYGLTEADYKGLNVEGKAVAVQIGGPGDTNAFGAAKYTRQKVTMAKEKGAIALVEYYNLPMQWSIITNYLSRPRMQLSAGDVETLSTFWVNDSNNTRLKALKDVKKPTIQLSSSGSLVEQLPTQNVVGYIEGTDASMKKEYIMMTAHFDHIGIGEEGARNVKPDDKIFNGARDNAIGTTAIMSAARILAKNPPKRSVVLIAFTAEEMGLLGSRYYAENPMMPLHKCIFNLNIDNGGYNDTEIVTVIGLERTGASAELEKATAAFGLEAIDDPAPEQGLFDRSDNVNFAAKGIPSPTFSLGFRAFDEEIFRYYHQVTDEADGVDFDYVLKYCQSYTYAAELIANREKAPQWQKGDKYEEAAKALYGEE